MLSAIEEAKKCEVDVPIGCVIKLGDNIITSAHNEREESNDITAHAEIIAIKKAQKVLNSSRLNGCTMYVTLEPCPMCAWAILQSNIDTLYFGAYNMQYGAFGSAIDLTKLCNSKIKIYGGIEEEQCNILLKDFFEKIRGKSGVNQG